MRPPDLRLVLVALLGLSLTGKAIGSFDLREVSGPQDVSVFLHAIGYSGPDGGLSHGTQLNVTRDAWTRASRGSCLIEVAQVSPQGWERDAVREYAGSNRLAYFYEGGVYPEHPVGRAMTDYYLARVKGYLHIPFNAPRVWAVVAGPQCPDPLLTSWFDSGSIG